LRRAEPGKVILLLGARRVGKTVLVQRIAERFAQDVMLLDGEDFTTFELLKTRSIDRYRRLFGTKTLVIIDEAQKIEGIGDIAKLMIDHLSGLRMILTGSSAFDLSNRFGEPLTGRKVTFHLYPLSHLELSQSESILETTSRLEERMIFGGYPEVWQYADRHARISYLKELANDYLLKDILQYEGIRNAAKIANLLRLISFQIGKEVSNYELGRQLGLTKNTIEKYLDLLTKVFVLFQVRGFSRNLRKEVSKSSRWYFYDTGIRNTFTANFNESALRPDIGELWENYALSERLKVLAYRKIIANTYFWRTYDQQEIDWVEERDGQLHAFEMKWTDRKVRVPAAWNKAYPGSTFTIIRPDNYFDWLEQ
jgi:uncharacterized protein